MRIKSISLSWFRGVADGATLEVNGKSVVVYGPNGSGKSTFPDALEHLITGGKVGHLSHEYSGSKLEKAVRNTHTPPEASAAIDVLFQNGDQCRAEIAPEGALSTTSSGHSLKALEQVGLERLILRQDEVSHFVHSTKGAKYSALLPLLGLSTLEQAAENLHKLSGAVSKKGELEEKRRKLEELRLVVSEYWPNLDREGAKKAINDLASTYLAEPPSADPTQALADAIQARLQTVDSEHRRHTALERASDADLPAALNNLVDAERKLREETNLLLDHQIAVLDATDKFASVADDQDVPCPACGRPIRRDALATHVREALEALGRARDTRERAREARRRFAPSVRSVLEALETASWSEADRLLSRLNALDLDRLDDGWDLAALEELHSGTEELERALEQALANPPPSTNELFEHGKKVAAAQALIDYEKLQNQLQGLERLDEALQATERAVREKTKEKTRIVLEDISANVQRLWAMLHPGEKVEHVHLHIPNDADKAIDIALKFHGVEQPSPRLTLSEGHRNSLGLCIFFALALANNENAPVVLDDIVSSLDREHRGMLVNVFLSEFADRQVLLFTHDREWYSELRARLPEKAWSFKRLRPWSHPTEGSRWAESSGDFDDARALLAIKPEAAGNEVRKIMDTETAKAAEKLQINMPYRQGDRNDHRTCHDFLGRILSDGKKRLKQRNGESYETPDDIIGTWEEALRLLESWGNRASHGGSLTNAEAEHLIVTCEKALEGFRCQACNDWVWISEQGNRERLQCSCDGLRWTYA